MVRKLIDTVGVIGLISATVAFVLLREQVSLNTRSVEELPETLKEQIAGVEKTFQEKIDAMKEERLARLETRMDRAEQSDFQNALRWAGWDATWPQHRETILRAGEAIRATSGVAPTMTPVPPFAPVGDTE